MRASVSVCVCGEREREQIRMPIVTERVEFPEACWERITAEAKSLITAMLVVDHEVCLRVIG